MSVTIDTSQRVGLHVDAFTATGAPAVLDGDPTWVTSDASVAVVGASGFDVSVVSVGVGTCTVTVTGVSFGNTITEVEEIIVVEAPAVATDLVITAGVPEPK